MTRSWKVDPVHVHFIDLASIQWVLAEEIKIIG